MSKPTGLRLNTDLIDPNRPVNGWMTLAITSVNMKYDKTYVENISPHIKVLCGDQDYRLNVGGDATISDPNSKLAEQFSNPLAERSIIKLAIVDL